MGFESLDKAIKKYESTHKVMSLDGGIDIYSFVDRRFKTDIAPKGRKVRYLNKNGYDSNREYANKYIREGQVLTIEEIYVGRSSSEVEFEELPGKKFNTVMFEDVEVES